MIADPSPYLTVARTIAGNRRRDELRRTSPQIEAALFLHQVTGLTDLELWTDKFGNVIGARARRVGVPEPVYVEMRL